MGKPYSSTHIYHITDTTDKRAQAKVDGAYSLHRGRFGVRDAGYTFVPADDTIDIGIGLSEVILNSQRPDKLVVAVNLANADKKDGTVDNVRNDFFAARLRNNVFVTGTSNGHELSYVKDEIVELFRLTTTNSKKSQFRSLEILPEAALAFADPKLRKEWIASGALARETDIDKIVRDAPPQTHVFEVDNFKNVKVVPSQEDLKFIRSIEGQSILFGFSQASVEHASRPLLGDAEHKALVAPTLFAAPTGTNVLALRSSSRRFGEDSTVPIIATIRENPAKTEPSYPVPKVGAPIFLGVAAG